MVEALSLNELQNKIRERYDHDEQRVVGIMLARYDIGITTEIVDQCYQYWNLNSKKYFDVFWAGYGAYLSPSDESATKTILKFMGNEKRAYFDLEAFIEIKDQFNSVFKSPYRDRLQLILVNYRDGKLHFNESLKIDLEENLDPNYAKIREIMEFVTWECHSAHQVSSIARKLKFEHFKDIIKGVTLSDVMSTAIGLAGINPTST
jgi:hypothetical protein